MDTQDTNGVNTAEDSEMAECDGEKVVTMMDVLQEQQDFEDDANAVLGASDDKECTYSKGYIKRQAIYACLTCCGDAKTDPSKRAGLCLACSLNCHENHELVELYTKRNFRCDCGNPKFTSNPCQFTPDKSELNEDNNYNQNFSGLYCICSRPYPDPESNVEEEMIQCIICEDWLHATHLEAKLPPSDISAEMVCKGCMEKNEFLHDYSNLAVNMLENEEVDVDDSINKDSTVNGKENEVDADDSINKDSSVNGEAEVKVDEFNESAVEADNTITDVVMDESKAEKTAQSIQAEEKPENMDDAKKEAIPEAAESAAETKTDPVEAETCTEEPSKVEEALSDGQVEPKETEATPVPTETKEDAESTTTNSVADGGEKAVPSEEKATEDIPEEQEKPTDELKEKLEDKSEPAAEDINATEKVAETEKEENPTKTDESRESISDPAADDDNKEIDAIDKLLAEGTSEEKSQTDPTPENTETNVDSLAENKEPVQEAAAETTHDTTNKAEEPNQTVEMKEDETKTNENTEVESSKVVNDVPTSDVDMNEDSTNAKETSEATPTTEPLTNGSSNGNDNKRKLSTEDEEETSKKPKLDSSACVRPKSGKKIFKGATFWPSHFRQKLCTCNECITMYKDLSVLFLTDLEDTVAAYEDLGKARTNGAAVTQYEKGLEALSSLDRIQQINALTEYNRMRDKLLDFLKSFKDRKEVVKEEDIKAFFSKMKPKREPDGVYFCR